MNNKNIIKTARFHHISGMRFAVCKRGEVGSRRLQTAGGGTKRKGKVTVDLLIRVDFNR